MSTSPPAKTRKSRRKIEGALPDFALLCSRIAVQLPVLDARRAGAELYGAPRLNAFSLFRPNENTISRIISDLLDPFGTHGQGSLFINAVLEAVKLPKLMTNDPVRVRREMPTENGRRIDLVIETPDALLGIENKPWAGQQPRQLEDYLRTLRSWTGRKEVALAFLSHQEAKTSKGDIVAITFADEGEGLSLSAILTKCLDDIRALRVRTHIEEFIQYIDLTFGGDETVDESEEPYLDAVLAQFQAATSRRAVAAMLLSHDVLRQTITNEIGGHLLTSLRAVSQDFEVVDEENLFDCISQKWMPWKLRRPSWPTNLSVAVEADRADARRVFFGVLAPDPKDTEIRAEKAGCPARVDVEQALRAIGGGSRSKYWPWWAYASTEHWGVTFTAQMVLHSPTGNVGDHPEIAELTERMLSLVKAVEAALPDER